MITNVFGWAKRNARRAVAAQRAYRDYNDLLTMPDHMLRDVGLTRDMVRHERRRLMSTGVIGTARGED